MAHTKHAWQLVAACTCVTHGGDVTVTSTLASSDLRQPVFPADRASKQNAGL